MTDRDQPTAGVALKPLYGHLNYLKDPDGLARIRESLIQTPDWHSPAPINCNSLARLLDTIEALRTPTSGPVEADDRLAVAVTELAEFRDEYLVPALSAGAVRARTRINNVIALLTKSGEAEG